jgi:phosphoglycolate phosphatase-like HAD superfamily hydrolase
MIGDALADIMAGKAAGTHTALFLPDEPTSLHDVKALRATDPTYIFHCHSALPEILALS